MTQINHSLKTLRHDFFSQTPTSIARQSNGEIYQFKAINVGSNEIGLLIGERRVETLMLNEHLYLTSGGNFAKEKPKSPGVDIEFMGLEGNVHDGIVVLFDLNMAREYSLVEGVAK